MHLSGRAGRTLLRRSEIPVDDEDITRIEEFVSDVVVLGIDSETAQAYGVLRHRLRLKGRPIPENDIWIAATALQYSMKLISRDAHFKDVDDLDLEVW